MASKPPAKLEPVEAAPDEADLVRELEPFLIPNKRPQAERVISMQMQKLHAGPLPAPEDLEHYGRVIDGGPERIVAMAEEEQRHRHRMERLVVIGEFGIRLLGQVGALVTVISLAGLAAYCAKVGQPLVAGVVVAIGGAATVFLKYSARKIERAEPPAKTPPKRKRK